MRAGGQTSGTHKSAGEGQRRELRDNAMSPSGERNNLCRTSDVATVAMVTDISVHNPSYYHHDVTNNTADVIKASSHTTG